ncbi:MAG: phenylalanine--tRNA ligase subunit beta [Chrysothrix sp. TS-e1954]|nr:MAG: phenylalanine--tRNA ligase subunit beta [Chrysothrix sp. TS-e1954]
MPTIAVDKARLFNALGRDYTKDEFDELCFDYGECPTLQARYLSVVLTQDIVVGIELDEDIHIDQLYDLLCFEGIALNLQVFLQRRELPDFKLVAPPNGALETVVVQPETAQIRPLFTGAVLRNVKFTKDRYDSFIALQDKLHQNLARQRSLVAIGTHDLDKIEGPFSYEALPPEQIRFQPLNQQEAMNAREMMDFYEKDRHMSRYLPIIRDSPVYPIIYDSNRTVLSMPPIINGDVSKITLDTRNIFIDVTATDRTKIDIVINIMVTMFSVYCEEPFTIEPIEIKSPHNHQGGQAPNLSHRSFDAEVAYLNSATGLSLAPAKMCELLKRMGLSSEPSKEDPKGILNVSVPPNRADILHQADIMEDLAVCYGFNELPRERPFLRSITFAAPLPISKLADIARYAAAKAGWTEVLSLILCSHDENFAWLKRKDVNPDGSGSLAVRLQNPKTSEYQVPRTSLVPGLLKSLNANAHHRVPMKIFEVSDVTFKDLKKERKARNQRNFAAAFCGKASGFEQVHGLLDTVMDELKCPFLTQSEVTAKSEDGKPKHQFGYWIEISDEAMFMPGYGAAIRVRQDGEVETIGTSGVLHPDVLKSFDIEYAVSTLEINLEGFL